MEVNRCGLPCRRRQRARPWEGCSSWKSIPHSSKELNTAHLPADSPYLRNTCDVVLVCGGQRFPAHKALLALKSRVLQEAFDATEGGEEGGEMWAGVSSRPSQKLSSCFEGHSAQEMSDLLRLLYLPQTFTLPVLGSSSSSPGSGSGGGSGAGSSAAPTVPAVIELPLKMWETHSASKEQVEAVAKAAASVLPLVCKLQVEDEVAWFDVHLNAALQRAVLEKDLWLELVLLADRHRMPALLACCEHYIAGCWNLDGIASTLALARLSTPSLHRIVRAAVRRKGGGTSTLEEVRKWQDDYSQ